MCRNQCLNLYGPTLLGFSIAGLIYVYSDPTYTKAYMTTKNGVNNANQIVSILQGYQSSSGSRLLQHLGGYDPSKPSTQ